MTPQEFEHQVTRIINLLEDKNALVTWNKHIPDPDNPSQQRQIDIEVNKGGQITHIECRHRSTPQDVTWVESLIGRKLSLGVDCIIGVSSSGFTEGAKRKAKARGVILKELSEITDTEVFFWSGDIEFSSSIFNLMGIGLSFFAIDSHTEDEAEKEARELIDKNSPLWTSIKLFLDRLPVSGLKEELKSGSIYLVEFDLTFSGTEVNLDNIRKIGIQFFTKFFRIKAKRTNKHSFGEYNGEMLIVDAVIENSQLPNCNIEVIHTAHKIGLIFNHSLLPLEKNSYTSSSIKIEHGEAPEKELYIETNSIEIIDAEFDFTAYLVKTNGSRHQLFR